jgi:hypothetical protein
MPDYSDPGKLYTLEYVEGWLPLTHEGSPHVSFASLTTGGYLKIEAYQFEQPTEEQMRAERTLRALLQCERQTWPTIGVPTVTSFTRNGVALAYTSYTRVELAGDEHAADFGHTRVWIFSRGAVQVRCLYRCRSSDAGIDDDELDTIVNSMTVHDTPRLDASSFTNYYFSLLKRMRPKLAANPPHGLALTLGDGQTILLEQLFQHYLHEPQRMDELIETHIHLLDYCGDDVPDLSNYKLIKPLLFPKLCRSGSSGSLPHRIRFWPGLSIGAVIQGTVFNYGVNVERLKSWGFDSLGKVRQDLIDNLYNISPVAPRGLCGSSGNTDAISYVDHPFSASFVLFEDFYETTAHNLNAKEFLVGLPDPSCVSCFRDDDPKFVVQHTAMLRWDYHHSVERLSDTIYQLIGPASRDVKAYDILHCCAKKP